MTVVETTPETVLEGLAVGAGGKAQCDHCHEPVREGDRVGIYAYQMVEWPEPVWDLPTSLPQLAANRGATPCPTCRTVGRRKCIISTDNPPTTLRNHD